MRARRWAELVVVLAAALTGCHFETKDYDPAYKVVNGTRVTVEIRYLTDRTDLLPEALERLRSVAMLEPGEEARFGSLGNDEDTCLDAPLVAIGTDGTEIDRLPTGVCAATDVDPTWTVTAP